MIRPLPNVDRGKVLFGYLYQSIDDIASVAVSLLLRLHSTLHISELRFEIALRSECMHICVAYGTKTSANGLKKLLEDFFEFLLVVSYVSRINCSFAGKSMVIETGAVSHESASSKPLQYEILTSFYYNRHADMALDLSSLLAGFDFGIFRRRVLGLTVLHPELHVILEANWEEIVTKMEKRRGVELSDGQSPRIYIRPVCSSEQECFAVAVDIPPENLSPISFCDGRLSLEGFIPSPKSWSSSRSGQHFFVNGTLIANKDIRNIVGIICDMWWRAEMDTNRLQMLCRADSIDEPPSTAVIPPILLSIKVPDDFLDIKWYPSGWIAEFSDAATMKHFILQALEKFLGISDPTDIGELKEERLEFLNKAKKFKSSYYEKRHSAPECDALHKEATIIARISLKEALTRGRRRKKTKAAPEAPVESRNPENPKESHKSQFQSQDAFFCENIFTPTPSATQISAYEDSGQRDVNSSRKLTIRRVRNKTSRVPEYVRTQCEREARDVVDIETAGKAVSISREDFQKMSVVGQFDRKCIVIRAAKSLYAIDQHASHERVRLERFVRAIFEKDKKIFAFTRVSPSRILLTSEMFGYLKRYQGKIERWGFRYVLGADNSCMILKVPVLFSRRLGLDHLKRFAFELDSKGGISGFPGILWNIIVSKACKGAIKFNQELTKGQIETLMLDLSQCKNPFSCAHGRPSFSYICDLEMIPAVASNIAHVRDVLR